MRREDDQSNDVKDESRSGASMGGAVPKVTQIV